MSNKRTDAIDKAPLPERFVSRWSRRKQQALKDPLDEPLLTPKAPLPASSHDIVDPAAKTTDEAPNEQERLDALNTLTDEDMPDVDTLDESSDYAGFMSKNVSDMLRKMALRKLFSAESYNVRDGLDEYDGDYTVFEKLDPSTVTVDMKHMLDVNAKRLAEAFQTEEEQSIAQQNLKSSDNNKSIPEELTAAQQPSTESSIDTVILQANTNEKTAKNKENT